MEARGGFCTYPKKDGFQNLYLDYSLPPGIFYKPVQRLPSSYTYEVPTGLGVDIMNNNTDRVPNPGVLGDQREQIRHNQLYTIGYQVTGLTGKPHGVLLKPTRVTSLGAWGGLP